MRWSRRRRRRRGDRDSSPSHASRPPSYGRVTRDVIGPTGWLWSNAWDQLAEHGDAYRRSFDRRLPPSLFVSERDRQRAGQPMPVSERCIEDYHLRRSANVEANRSSRSDEDE